MADKVIKDGEVAVLIASGYGAGWSTWNFEYEEKLLFEPTVVDMLINGKSTDSIVEYIEKTYPDVYLGGIDDGLYIEWIPVGTKFRVDEYDGAENLVTADDLRLVA